MRTTSLLLSASVGALVAAGVSTGAAWAAPLPAAVPTAFSAAPTASAPIDPWYVPVSAAEENQPADLPWGWLTTGVLVLFGGGAGSAYLISRRGQHVEENDGVPTSNERVHV